MRSSRGAVIVSLLASLDAIAAFAQPSARPRPITGVVVDSVSGAAVDGARVAVERTAIVTTTDAAGRFTLTGIASGEQTLAVRTSSLDSMKAVHRVAIVVSDSASPLRIRVPNATTVTISLCGERRLPHPGIVYGTVDIEGEATPPRNVRVVAAWSEAADGSIEGRTNAQGVFRLCGVPLDAPVQVRAVVENTSAAPYPVQVPSAGRMVRADLTLDRQTETGGVFTGTVFAGPARAPIVSAEVFLPDLAKRTLTDERGNFRLAEIPAGEHDVLVRRVGYNPLQTRIAFAAGATVDRKVTLDRVVTLDSVVTKSAANTPSDFEENRRLGLGSFFTRAELAKLEGNRLGDILSQMPGLGVVRGRASGAWILSKRRPPSLPSPTGVRDATNYYPEKDERTRGVIAACYAQVYLDQVLMNPQHPTEPFDVNSISPSQIEAIEFYASPAETPLKFSKLNSTCGVLVIHTRRSP